MNEAETRAELIDPALRDAGWGVVESSRVRREVITLGRLQGAGKRARQDIADYVLIYRGQKLAVIEAKKRSLPVTEGLAQAKRYAECLQTRFAYATNGVGIYQVDMHTGAEESVDAWPSPDALWAATFGQETNAQQIWRERFGAVPFEDKGGAWQARYYQHNAINQALEAVAAGRDRILLVLDQPPTPDMHWDGAAPNPATSQAPYRLYNIGNQQPVELLRYIEVLEQCLKRSAVKKLLPLQPGDVPDTYADVSELVHDLGYQPTTPIEVGIQRFVDWYVEHANSRLW